MEFWNDFEGKTVAAFPLHKLLRPEGRSAFFATTATDGKPAILRLTESLLDQDELVERWRQITALADPNLIAIKSFGSTNFDGVPLTYALMESPDASLADMLAERPLTATETLQIAIAVTATLRTLHAASFTHDHIEPSSVYALGESIKLRSDCIRECIADPEFNPEALCQERRQRDLHDLGILLLQCLTLEKLLHPAIILPAPFDQVVRHAIHGTWTLDQIATALNPPPVRPLVPASVLAAAHSKSSSEPTVKPETSAQRELPLRPFDDSYYAPERAAFPVWARSPRLWIAVSVALLIVFLVAHIHSAPAIPPQISAVSSPAVVVGAAPRSAPARAPERQPGWRVIVYTYTQEAQAFAKATAIQARHPDLQPQVFAHNQHAPFLVSLGGPMSRDEAQAMLQKARRAGLPRDSFVRLYNS